MAALRSPARNLIAPNAELGGIGRLGREQDDAALGQARRFRPRARRRGDIGGWRIGLGHAGRRRLGGLRRQAQTEADSALCSQIAKPGIGSRLRPGRRGGDRLGLLRLGLLRFGRNGGGFAGSGGGLAGGDPVPRRHVQLDGPHIPRRFAWLQGGMDDAHILIAGIKKHAAAARDGIDGHFIATVHALRQSHAGPGKPDACRQQRSFSQTHGTGPRFDKWLPRP